MTNQRLSELRHKGYITDTEYKEIKNTLYAIDAIKQEIEEKDEYMIDKNGLYVYALWTDDILRIIDKHTKGESE